MPEANKTAPKSAPRQPRADAISACHPPAHPEAAEIRRRATTSTIILAEGA